MNTCWSPSSVFRSICSNTPQGNWKCQRTFNRRHMIMNNNLPNLNKLGTFAQEELERNEATNVVLLPSLWMIHHLLGYFPVLEASWWCFLQYWWWWANLKPPPPRTQEGENTSLWRPNDGAERFQILHQNSDLYNDKSQVNWKRNVSPVLESVSVIVWGTCAELS